MAKARTRRPPGRRPAPKKRRSPPSRTQRLGRGPRKALSLHNGGKVGVFLALLFRGLFGYGAYAVPVLFAGLGLALFRRSAAKADDAVAGRVAIGLLALLLGGLGLLHLARGAPPTSARPSVLQDSGGLVGAAVVAPLARRLSTCGAGTAFACLLFLGALISTRTSVASVGRGIAAAGKGLRAVVTPPPRPAADADADLAQRSGAAGGRQRTATQTAGDEAGADGPDETPARRRGRRRGEPAGDSAHGPEAPDAADAAVAAAGEAVQLAMTVQAKAGGVYTSPPESLLRRGHARPIDARRLDETARILENTLDQFEVDARVARYTRGPTVTRYEVELGPATKVARVIGLSHDIAYALASPDVRIIAPIPGKSAIGIEVPNRDRALVTLGDILGRVDKDEGHPLTVALGKDIGGEPVLANLTDMPHVLIAGSTGSGKSVSLNVLVTSLLMRNPPERVRLILIDPKRVELTHYDGVPHLITPVVTHPKRASEALAWAVREMELRLETLAIAGVRNIAAYNQAAKEGTLPPLPSASLDDAGRPDGDRERPTLPYIVVVIDELSDLMMIAPRDVEDAICRIAQMARAVGIHLVVATQRPSVDVVTGLIKANIPSRIAFMVASAQD